MPTLDWKLKDCTTTQQTIFFRTDTNGTAKVTASNGQTASVALLTATDDGTGTVTVTGVTDGMAFTVYLDDVEDDTGNFNLAPSEGDRFSIIGFSCFYQSIQKDAAALRHAVHEPRLKMICDQGDTPYMQDSSTTFGVTTVDSRDDLATAQAEATYNNHHLKMLRTPAFQLAGHKACYIDGYDDHEGPTNNWDHTVATANVDASFVYADQDEIDGAFQAAMNSFRYYSKGNPSWDSPINQKPPNTNLTDNDFEVGYSAKEFGDALVITLDCLTARGAIGGDNTMLGTTQLAQLKSDVAATTKTWVIINSPKPLMQDTNGNTDGFTESAATEEADIISTLGAESKGIIWMGGDDHLYIHSETTSPDFTSMTVSSISQDIKTGRSQNANNKVLDEDFHNCYWLLDVQGATKIDVYAVNIFGDRRHAGALLPGAKLLV